MVFDIASVEAYKGCGLIQSNVALETTMGMSLDRWMNGRDCRSFELELALGIRLVKTAALAHRACDKALSELLVEEARKKLHGLLIRFESLASADKLGFEALMNELRDRIEEYQRLVRVEQPPRERARQAGSAEGSF